MRRELLVWPRCLWGSCLNWMALKLTEKVELREGRRSVFWSTYIYSYHYIQQQLRKQLIGYSFSMCTCVLIVCPSIWLVLSKKFHKLIWFYCLPLPSLLRSSLLILYVICLSPFTSKYKESWPEIRYQILLLFLRCFGAHKFATWFSFIISISSCFVIFQMIMIGSDLKSVIWFDHLACLVWFFLIDLVSCNSILLAQLNSIHILCVYCFSFRPGVLEKINLTLMLFTYK